ncbi:uncharacterized protein LAESUDRAFT_180420 [Laetiporus sulphureus 93-53]|uniref:Thioesterase domain-containing protein n=1 Tax=Laetiporus sulphureus 93-53 TaxID=1314785 RepID=A0A165E8U1_9APHY|nr:uncharacterized protein LAESUDRAFT_180420 [Laetiporus sulphureus 93-53]KZT06484.1 hypothetical protein LAESUDRAFT_180420 [Laetiporus sulphureus 93-53]
MDFLAKAHKLPPAPPPNNDPSSVKGNISLEKKDLAQRIMAWHIGNYPGSKIFGRSELSDLKLTEVAVRTVGMGDHTELVGEDVPVEELRKMPLEVQSVMEIKVKEEMLNVHKTLAGGCSAHLLDVGTFSPLLILSLVTGIDATGVSMAMNLVWHSAAPLGTELKIVGTSLSLRGGITAARSEVYDKKTKRLLVSAVHTIAPFAARAPKSSDKQGSKSRL